MAIIKIQPVAEDIQEAITIGGDNVDTILFGYWRQHISIAPLINLVKTNNKKLYIHCSIGNAENNYDVLTFGPSLEGEAKIKYLISEHLNDIDGISISTHLWETGSYSRWVSGLPYKHILDRPQGLSFPQTLAELNVIKDTFPEIPAAGKLICNITDSPIDREAMLYQNDIANAPILNWLKQQQAKNISYYGNWALYKDYREFFFNCHEGVPGKKYMSPILKHNYRQKGQYPYTYLQTYLNSGVDFYSGIGFTSGIKQNNAQRLLQIGYKNVVLEALHLPVLTAMP